MMSVVLYLEVLLSIVLKIDIAINKYKIGQIIANNIGGGAKNGLIKLV